MAVTSCPTCGMQDPETFTGPCLAAFRDPDPEVVPDGYHSFDPEDLAAAKARNQLGEDEG